MKLLAWFVCVVSMTVTLINIILAETTLKQIVHISQLQMDIPVVYIVLPIVSFLYVATLAILYPVTQKTVNPKLH